MASPMKWHQPVVPLLTLQKNQLPKNDENHL